MGYYTQYTLDVVELYDEKEKDVILAYASLSDICNSYHQHGDKYDLSFGDTTDDIKWYGHHEDMLKLSIAFPDVAFSLHGVGEEQGDEWIAYYKAGKHVVHSRDDWTPPPFNEENLQG